MKTAIISKEQQAQLDALDEERKRRRSTAAYRVASLTAFAIDPVFDQDRLYTRLLLLASDEHGQPVSDVFIDYKIVNDGGTGTGFVVEGVEAPRSSSFGWTQAGYALANDDLLTGKKAGIVTIRATAPDDATTDVFANFTLEVSSQIPTTVHLRSGGDQSVPISNVVDVHPDVQLLDQKDNAVGYGMMRFQLYDPNLTGSTLYFGGRPIAAVDISLAVDGSTTLHADLVVGSNAPGKDVYIRANRTGRDPHLDIRYTTVKQIKALAQNPYADDGAPD